MGRQTSTETRAEVLLLEDRIMTMATIRARENM